MMCGKCTKATGWVFAVLAVLYLIVDFGFWNFFGIQWWSALFVALAVIGFASGSCSDCGSCCSSGSSTKKEGPKKM